MTSVKLKFRPSTVSDRPGNLYYQVIHARQTRRLKTPHRLYPAEWDAVRQTVVVPACGVRRIALLALTAVLAHEASHWEHLIETYSRQGAAYSVDVLVSAYCSDPPTDSFFVFSRRVVAALSDGGQLRTAEAYDTALGSLAAYLEGCDVSVDGVTSTLVCGYERWLRRRGVSANGSSFYLRILRALYNRAVRQDLVAQTHPFRSVYTRVARTTKRALSADIVERIAVLDLRYRPALAFARDMFLFSFFTRGMSFVDMAFLRCSQVSGGRLVYRRHKTGQLLSLKWEPCMQALVDRYAAQAAGGYLLPLVDCGGVAGRRSYLVAAHRVRRNLRSLGRLLGLVEPLTMYVARHSWASIARSRGVPLAVISEGMGHDSERTTRIYLAALDGGEVDRANELVLAALRGRVAREG